MHLYQVTDTLHHDGRPYGAGETVELAAAAAATLLAAGVVTRRTPVDDGAPNTTPMHTQRDQGGPHREVGASGGGGGTDEPGASGGVAGAGGEGPPARAELVRTAIAAMLEADPEKKNDDWWLRDGRPEVKALEQRLGFDTTAKERDRIWQAMGAD